MPPQAILFDLDDTLISAYSGPRRDVWRRTLEEFRGDLGGAVLDLAADSIDAAADAFWADPTRHRVARLDLAQARFDITGAGLWKLGIADAGLTLRIADAFHTLRDSEMKLFPHAHELLDALRNAGVRLALVTNGASDVQRDKINRFDLEHRFEHIQVEGEVGFGKPDPQAYHHAMQALGAGPHQTWMVGDNLEWEVAAPKQLGIHTVWHDHAGNGLPGDAPAKPDRIIRGLAELMEGF